MLRDDIFSFQFLKKSRFTGSYRGMAYRLEKAQRPSAPPAGPDTDGTEAEPEMITVLSASVFPDVCAFEYTAPDEITTKDFDFSEEGCEQAKDWLTEQSNSCDWLQKSREL